MNSFQREFADRIPRLSVFRRSRWRLSPYSAAFCVSVGFWTRIAILSGTNRFAALVRVLLFPQSRVFTLCDPTIEFLRPFVFRSLLSSRVFSMRRQFFGLVSCCLMFTLIGCGEKATVEPIDTGGDSAALPDLTTSTTDKGDSSADSSGGSSEDAHKGHNHGKQAKGHGEPMEGRKTLDGNWLLAFTNLMPPQREGQELQAEDRALLLFKVAGADGDSPTISIIAGRQGLEQVEFRDLKINDGAIEFEATNAQGVKAFDYSGKLFDGLVIGSTLFADGRLMVSRLLPTDEKTFARIPLTIPLPETQMFIQLGTSPVPDEDVRAFNEMLPASPLGRMAYLRLVNMTAGNKASVEELERVIGELTESVADWGERVVTYSEFESFSAVSVTGYDVDWCLAKADEIEEKLNASEDLKSLAANIAGIRTQIKYRQTTELLGSKKEVDRAKGRELAEEFLKKTPFEPMLSSLLADDARLYGSKDEALQRYAALAALPMQERMLQQFWASDPVQKIIPTERVATLWKEKHGGTDGMDEFLAEVYDKELLSFVDPPVASTPEDADKHIVLVELFTGTRCPPCVAADVGLEGIEKTYSQSQVITLRYHVHVPGHDPLTNEDSEARFHNYYKAAGTPTMFVDGHTLSGVAGFMPGSPQTYRGLRNAIDHFRDPPKTEEPVDSAAEKPESSDESDEAESKDDAKETTTDDKETDDRAPAADDAAEKAESSEADKVEPQLTIDLKVSRQQDTIQVSATVNGLTSETPNVRLMLALAESGIHYEAFNGIRHHDMVVRQLIGGDRGTGLKDGALAYQGSVNVEELRDHLHSYLTKFEENQGVEFTSMPLELSNLSVVAFVQEVESRKVLRSAIAPVTGAAAGN